MKSISSSYHLFSASDGPKALPTNYVRTSDMFLQGRRCAGSPAGAAAVQWRCGRSGARHRRPEPISGGVGASAQHPRPDGMAQIR